MQEIDVVYVSAVCSFPQKSEFRIPAQMKTVQKIISNDGSSRYMFESRTIEVDQFELRQKEFSEALETIRLEILDFGITAEILRDSEADLSLFISLQSESGQASVTLTKAMMSAWSDLPTDFSISAI